MSIEPEVILYTEHIVSFIDVMGFKELLKPTPESLRKMGAFFALSKDMLLYKQNLYRGKEVNSFKFLIVSDSIVIAKELPRNGQMRMESIASFLALLGRLQFSLALDGDIWTRGGVSIGNLFFNPDQSMLVGPAFVTAYNLEAFANYPRIIVDPQVCTRCELLPETFVESINDVGYDAVILPLGPNAHGTNALQIDWFYRALLGNIPTARFFKGFEARYAQDQSLFEKCRRLGQYLSHSISYARARGVVPESRLKPIADKIEALGFRTGIDSIL